jgi:hypothetical protein
VLQGVIDRLTEIGRRCGMEMNVGELRWWECRGNQPSADCDRSEQLENGEYFDCLGSTITRDASCTREVKRVLATAQAARNKKRAVFTNKLHWRVRKKLVRRHTWGTALCGAKTSKALHVGHSLVWR